MFGRDNHDGKENYKRDREDRLEHIENLNRKAQDEFNDSFFNRSDKFDDFHRNNNNYIHEDEQFTYHSEEDNKKENSNKIILSTVAIGVLGFLGYLGFNHSNNTTNQTPKACVEQKSEDNNNDVKSAERLAISQKIISSQNMELLKKEPIPTRTPEPIITPNAENKIVTSKIRPNSKENVKNIESSNYHGDKIEHKNESRVVGDRKAETRKVKKPQYRVITVKKGDTLASLAEKYYGNPMDFKRIIRANRDIKNSHSHLHLGQKVIIPIITHSNNARLVRVRKGDTLYSIAKRYYGSSKKYQKIIDANYKIKNIHTPLHVGEVIRVPK